MSKRSPRLAQRLAAAGVLIVAMAHTAISEESCQLTINVPAVISDSRVVLFGETHGTVEAPSLIGEYACWLIHRGDSVVVGLEIPVREQTALDKFMDGENLSQDRLELVRSTHWENLDGRASEAMFALIERLRYLRSSGGNVSVLAFDARAVGNISDAAMASRIMRSFQPSGKSKLIVLTGNLHAMTSIGSTANPKFAPMGFHLLPLKPLSLIIEFVEGNAWFCAPKCGVHPLRINQGQNATGIRLGYSRLPGFDGTILLPMATPSKPMRGLANEN